MKLRDRNLDFTQPQVMAIVNVTDDSFYENSRCVDEDAIAERVLRALAEGASIIDIGGYSSRPDAEDVSLEEEWRRVERGLRVIRSIADGAVVSIDTFRAEVARRALDNFGDVIINDITAGEANDTMIDVVAEYDVPYIAMHMRGTPQTMQHMTEYSEGIVEAVCNYFRQRIEFLHDKGVNNLILDPGFGFAKSLEQNYELLAGLNRVVELGYPIMVGVSRKSMIYKTLNVMPSEALNGTTALHWEALRQGATILRVHDVKEACETVKLFEQYTKKR